MGVPVKKSFFVRLQKFNRAMHKGVGVFEEVYFVADNQAEPSNHAAYELLVNRERNAPVELGLKQEAEASNDALMSFNGER